MNSTALYGIVSVLAVAAGLGGYQLYKAQNTDQFAQCRTTSVAGTGQIGGPFELTDHTGAAVTDTDVIDGLTLIYFGYTFCPDVCPLDIARNAEAVELLEEQDIMVKPVMITIDPARDDAAALADFVSYMHPRMVGLTGTDDQIRDVAKEYKILYSEEDHAEDDEFYLISHSTNAYLMAPEHGLLQFFTRVERPEAMAQTIACFAENL